MANTQLSHLDEILKEFQVSGKQLGEYLNVDYSLVSKWRSGKRRLNSEYTGKLAELFLTLDEKYEYQRIEKLIRHQFTPKERENKRKMKAFLEFWLASQSIGTGEDSVESYMKKNCRKQSYYTFSGEQGRREAIHVFLDYLRNRQGVNLWLFSQEDNDWYYEDDLFLKEWQEKNMEVLRHGNTIHVIHPVELQTSRVAHFMFRWIPLHLVGNAKAYYIPKFWNSNIKVTIFLAEGELVLIGVTSEKFTKKMVTYLFTDGDALQNARDVLMELFCQSNRMFERYGFDSNGEFSAAFAQIIENKRPVYYFSGAPIMYMVPEKCLMEVLMENDYTEEEKREYAKILYKCSFEYMMSICKVPLTYVIHEEQLKRLLKQKRVMMRFSSHCLGRPFYVSQSTFRNLLRQSLDQMCEHEHLSIYIADQTLFYPFNDIAFFVKEKEVAGLVGTNYESSEGACALITYEDSVVSSLYKSSAHFVESLPSRKMSKEMVRDQILEMIESVS